MPQFGEEAVKLHASDHQDGGSDEIDVTGLSGDLAAEQDPKDHASDHESGGGDEVNVGGLSGELADPQPSTWAKVASKPSTFAPTAHAGDHENGGGDEIDVTGLSGDLADEQDPKDHASGHENGGGDEIGVGGLSGLLADNQDPVIHGAAKHTDITRTVFWLPGTHSTARSSFLSYGPVFRLRDSQTDMVFFYNRVPDDYVGDGIIHLIWACTTAAGNIYFRIRFQRAVIGAVYNVESATSAYAEYPTAGSWLINATEIAITGPLVAGEFIGLAVQRDSVNALDTLNALAHVIGATFTYTANEG